MLRTLSVAFLALGLLTSPVLAQAPKMFLASTGSDTNDGSRGSPKRTLQAGHDAVAIGGEVVILDTAGYGPFKISKSVGIVVPPGVNGFVTLTDQAYSNGTTQGISIDADSGAIVTLRGLIVEGPANRSGVGILASRFQTLVVEDTTVRNFGSGLAVASLFDAQLVVRGGAIRSATTGVDLQDAGPAVKVDATVTDTELTAVDRALSIFQGNQASTLRLVATRCGISGSRNYAFNVSGAGATAVADNCTIAGNGQVFFPDNGGSILTRGNNTIYNNTMLGITPTPLVGQ